MAAANAGLKSRELTQISSPTRTRLKRKGRTDRRARRARRAVRKALFEFGFDGVERLRGIHIRENTGICEPYPADFA